MPFPRESEKSACFCCISFSSWVLQIYLEYSCKHGRCLKFHQRVRNNDDGKESECASREWINTREEARKAQLISPEPVRLNKVAFLSVCQPLLALRRNWSHHQPRSHEPRCVFTMSKGINYALFEARLDADTTLDVYPGCYHPWHVIDSPPEVERDSLPSQHCEI